MAMELIINKVLMGMALRRQSRSTSTFKEEYWYSSFLKVVPLYAQAELLRTPQQCTPRSCTSDARATGPRGTSSRNRRPGRHPHHPSSCPAGRGRGGDPALAKYQGRLRPAYARRSERSVSLPPAAEPRRNPNDAYDAYAPRTEPRHQEGRQCRRRGVRQALGALR
jgi:hypothetical protein